MTPVKVLNCDTISQVSFVVSFFEFLISSTKIINIKAEWCSDLMWPAQIMHSHSGLFKKHEFSPPCSVFSCFNAR